MTFTSREAALYIYVTLVFVPSSCSYKDIPSTYSIQRGHGATWWNQCFLTPGYLKTMKTDMRRVFYGLYSLLSFLLYGSFSGHQAKGHLLVVFWNMGVWMQHGCLCQTGWSENRNCWSTRIFTLATTNACKTASLTAQYVTSWSRWATAVHTARGATLSGNWGYSLRRSLKPNNRKAKQNRKSRGGVKCQDSLHENFCWPLQYNAPIFW